MMASFVRRLLDVCLLLAAVLAVSIGENGDRDGFPKESALESGRPAVEQQGSFFVLTHFYSVVENPYVKYTTKINEAYAARHNYRYIHGIEDFTL